MYFITFKTPIRHATISCTTKKEKIIQDGLSNTRHLSKAGTPKTYSRHVRGMTNSHQGKILSQLCPLVQGGKKFALRI